MQTRNRLTLGSLALAAIATLAACAAPTSATPTSAAPARAVAELKPTAGNLTSGSVTFEQHGDHVMVTAKISGLAPNQEHGFHVHEKGDCSSPDALSAGGHFNPLGKPHGQENGPEHHAGDMPNLKADANGVATATFHVSGMAVGSGATDIIGRGLIVHAKPDDYRSQPVGNAGARLACAVIAKG
ncbi:superoxide dismutase family protein [Aquabacterium sp. A7-Y]|uniref:superoxide dismutase family protein n=1 Tax=Aquabacterium sp. A7-Y TaxID=1349605 RepID=UPI00223D2DC6|nr:superoxide dismutase family protein [Aquabacterium sp. A7-Y]MCW7540628.1 superoxide dismutase family protein [Aquabacterium sp. A7-Y]